MRRLMLLLVTMVAAGSAATVAPALENTDGSSCNPGNNCTGFERNAYEVTEGAKYVDLKVLAAWCCPAGQGQVDYETFAESAVAGKDYEHTSGTLTYAGGGGALIRVPISDDTLSEGGEKFVVRLTNFRGSFVDRGYEASVVTIFDRFVYETPSESASGDGSNRSGVLPTATAPPMAASARPAGSGSSVSASVDRSALPAGAGDDQTLSGRRVGNNAAAPVRSDRPSGGPSSAFLAILACILLATVAATSTSKK